jgi:hypothetical protein
LDQAGWSVVDRPHGAERRVHKQHAVRPDAKRAKLFGNGGFVELARRHDVNPLRQPLIAP